MSKKIETSPFASHKAVPTPTEGNSVVYTLVGSTIKWEKKSNGVKVPYFESLSEKNARIAAEKQSKEDAAFEATAKRLGYKKA